MKRASPGEDLTPLGQYIWDRLAEWKKDHTWFATQVGITRPSLSRYMRGKQTLPYVVFARMADVLGVEPGELARIADGESPTREYRGRVWWIADQLQQIADELPEHQANEVLDQFEGMVRLLRKK